MCASPAQDQVESFVRESPGHIYAVRFPWSEGWKSMVGFAEDMFGSGTVIEFDLGPMRRFPCICEGEAKLLVYTTDKVAEGAERDCAAIGQALAIERVWPR